MKTSKKFFALAVITLAFLASSCTRERVIVPSKNIEIEDFFVEDFDRLSIGSSFTCYVDFENTEDLRIEANENLLEYVEVKVRRGELRINLEDDVNLRKGATLIAYVGAKYLEAISASGASRVYLRDRLYSDYLKLNVSGASRIKGDIETDFLDADVSGASDLDLEGDVDEMELDGSGASNITGYDLVTDYLSIDLSGSTRAELSNEGKMDIRLSGASKFYYKGNGVISSIETSGASKVIKK